MVSLAAGGLWSSKYLMLGLQVHITESIPLEDLKTLHKGRLNFQAKT